MEWTRSASLVREASADSADAIPDALAAHHRQLLLPSAATEKRLLFKQRVFVVGSCPDVDHLVHWLNAGAAQVVYTGESESEEEQPQAEEGAAATETTTAAAVARRIDQIIAALGRECPSRRIALRVDLDDQVAAAAAGAAAAAAGGGGGGGGGAAGASAGGFGVVGVGVGAVAAAATAIQERLPGLGLEVRAGSAAVLRDAPVRQALLAAAKVLGEFRLIVRLVGAAAAAPAADSEHQLTPEDVAVFHHGHVNVVAGGFGAGNINEEATTTAAEAASPAAASAASSAAFSAASSLTSAAAAAATVLLSFAAACFVACARSDRADGLCVVWLITFVFSRTSHTTRIVATGTATQRAW